VRAVVGPTPTGDAEEAGSQQAVFGFESDDTLLEQGHAPHQGATSADVWEPAVMGAGDGCGVEEQGVVHRGNLAAARGDVSE